jgi:hypothetical protein
MKEKPDVGKQKARPPRWRPSRVPKEHSLNRLLRRQKGMTRRKNQSGRLDSNQRPLEPHSSALAKLRHAPMSRTIATDRRTRSAFYEIPPLRQASFLGADGVIEIVTPNMETCRGREWFGVEGAPEEDESASEFCCRWLKISCRLFVK